MKKKCAYCGSEFAAEKSTRQYCSRECARKANREKQRAKYLDKVAKRIEQELIEPPEWELPLPVCRNCGKEFKPDNSKQIYCSRKCYREYRWPKKNPSTKKFDGKTLGQWIQEAMNCNLDYGTYRGLIAAGKTYEELKAQAPQRQIRVHQHTPHRGE